MSEGAVLVDSFRIDSLLALEDLVLEHRLKGGNPAYTDERFEVFKKLLSSFEDVMFQSKKTNVNLTTQWEELSNCVPNDIYNMKILCNYC